MATKRHPVDWAEVDRVLSTGDFGRGEALLAPYSVDETDAREMVSRLKWSHYVYALCSGDVVFYIGKGAGSRMLQHRSAALAGDLSDKSEVIRRIGPGIRYCILVVCDSEEPASLIEAYLIKENWDVLLNKRKEDPEDVLARSVRNSMSAEVDRLLSVAHAATTAAHLYGARAAELNQRAKNVNASNWREWLSE